MLFSTLPIDSAHLHPQTCFQWSSPLVSSLRSTFLQPAEEDLTEEGKDVDYGNNLDADPLDSPGENKGISLATLLDFASLPQPTSIKTTNTAILAHNPLTSNIVTSSMAPRPAAFTPVMEHVRTIPFSLVHKPPPPPTLYHPAQSLS
ncbi:hypothetical protein H2248_002721 [Termitomyces sp. 'cryptogamus']|nr:hypothetical protein H2248_002721 [Termitomyces sp. 'cryptogamus']